MSSDMPRPDEPETPPSEPAGETPRPEMHPETPPQESEPSGLASFEPPPEKPYEPPSFEMAGPPGEPPPEPPMGASEPAMETPPPTQPMPPYTPPPPPPEMAPPGPPPPPLPPPVVGAPTENHRFALPSLIMGILSLLGALSCLCLFWLPFFNFCPALWSLALGGGALYTGNEARREIEMSGGTVGGRDQANAGFIMGIIGIVVGILGLCIAAAIVVGLIATPNNPFQNP